MAARRFRTDHYEHYVSPGEFRDFIPRYVWFMDEPVSEAAGISLHYISRLARKFVTVILSGEGSDELFGGYDIYRYMSWIESYRNLPAAIRKGIETGTGIVSSAGARWRKFVELASLPLEKRYRGVSLLPRSSFNGLFADVCQNWHLDPLAEEWERIFNGSRQWGNLNRLLHADTKTWLVDDILIKADKMTMANSLELRVPFLDYRIVELAASMPETMKIKGSVKKYILKNLVTDKVPQEIIRREKMGFPTPIEVMFRDHLNGYLKEILLDRRTLGRGYFSRQGIEKAIADHERGIDRSQLLWRLLVLEEWFRVFTDR
jgi:asparagine synthase (glutamine-hydrolysing)